MADRKRRSAISHIRLSLLTGISFGNLLVDGFATLFRVLVIGVGALTVLISNPFLARQGENSGEFYALVLLSLYLIGRSNPPIMLAFAGMAGLYVFAVWITTVFFAASRNRGSSNSSR